MHHTYPVKIYKACFQNASTYETETWAMEAKILHSLERAEHIMARWLHCVIEGYRKLCIYLLGIQDVADVVAD